MKPCLLIPVYNHGDTLPAVLDSLEDLDLPCIVIDDGSDAHSRAHIDECASGRPWVTMERFARNRGRGAALRHGYATAARDGFTHVVQLDADGQHCAADVPRILFAANVQPRALILGQPVFDTSAPRARRHGRKVSGFWVSIETLSRVIGDPLCGFRGVPVEPVLRLLERQPLGDRMDFDPELAVRWVWQGWPIAHVATRVVYPAGGRSNFRMFGDNVRISLMHARLTIGMLARLARRGRAR